VEVFDGDSRMISIYYGTRPEYIKVKLLYDKMVSAGFSVELVKVLQHTTLIEDCYSDREVAVGSLASNRLNCVVSACLADGVLHPESKLVLVQGDTATAFGVALNAFQSKIPIAHIEAGLRTYDRLNPYPEESYRRCISAMSTHHFCVTETNARFLRQEGTAESVYVVGNTSLDNLTALVPHYGNTVLVTLHRRENQEIMDRWFAEIGKASIENPHLKFIFPIHPSIKTDTSLLGNVSVVSPLSHRELLSVLNECKFVITDSGGIQEESAFLKKKSIVCRKTTERTEGIGVFSFLCEDPILLPDMIHTVSQSPFVDSDCPYGDGRATDKIIEILKDLNYD